MKTPLRLVLLSLCCIAIAAFAGSPPRVDVTVLTDPGGKVAYKGQADAGGAFATSALQPGNYVVQFNASSGAMKGQQFAIAVQAGKSRVVAKDVPGEKFSGGGVAMKVEVPKSAKLSGRISNIAATIASNQRMEKVRANVKIVNGKRYIWVPGQLGSNISGRWLEEGTEGAVLRTSNKKGGDADVLRKIQDQAGNIGDVPDGFGLPGPPPGY